MENRCNEEDVFQWVHRPRVCKEGEEIGGEVGKSYVIGVSSGTNRPRTGSPWMYDMRSSSGSRDNSRSGVSSGSSSLVGVRSVESSRSGTVSTVAFGFGGIGATSGGCSGSLKSTKPRFQSTFAFVCRNQGRPSMMFSLPRAVTRNRVRWVTPAMVRFQRTQWVMKPYWLGVPSTLNTGIGDKSREQVSPWERAKLRSIKIPPAPESTRARVSMIRSLEIETGIRMDWLDTSATITGETVILGRSDIGTVDPLKNPRLRQCSPLPPSRHPSIQRRSLRCARWVA